MLISKMTIQQRLQKNKHYDQAVNMVDLSTGYMVRIMVFNATFNNISVILWWSVLLVKETGIPRENHRPVASQ